jgi:hypothetical protein
VKVFWFIGLQSLKYEKKSKEDFTKISEFKLSQSPIQLSNKILVFDTKLQMK